jgi:hypothetical protein
MCLDISLFGGLPLVRIPLVDSFDVDDVATYAGNANLVQGHLHSGHPDELRGKPRVRLARPKYGSV